MQSIRKQIKAALDNEGKTELPAGVWKVGKLDAKPGNIFKPEKPQSHGENDPNKNEKDPTKWEWTLTEAQNELAKKDECFGFTFEGTQEEWEENPDARYENVIFISGSTSIDKNFKSKNGVAWCSYGACNRSDRRSGMLGPTDTVCGTLLQLMNMRKYSGRHRKS